MAIIALLSVGAFVLLYPIKLTLAVLNRSGKTANAIWHIKDFKWDFMNETERNASGEKIRNRWDNDRQ